MYVVRVSPEPVVFRVRSFREKKSSSRHSLNAELEGRAPYCEVEPRGRSVILFVVYKLFFC